MAGMLIVVFLIPCIFWIWSVVLLSNQPQIVWKFIAIHLIIIATYVSFWEWYSVRLTAHGEFNLPKIVGYVALIYVHSIIGFLMLRAYLYWSKRR